VSRHESHHAGPAEAAVRWSALADALDAVVVVVELETGLVVELNDAARRELRHGVAPGETPADHLGRPFAELCAPELAEALPALLHGLAEQPGRRFGRRHVTWPGRGLVPVEIVATAAPWDGRPAAVVVVRDTSARAALMQQSLELQEVEQRFREAFDEAAIGMSLIAAGPDPEAGTFLEVNRSLATMVGRTPEGLAGVTFTEISHPDDVEIGLTVFDAVTRGEIPRGVAEKRYRHADGHDVWVRVTISAVHAPSGEVRHLVAQVEDITARKTAEAELVHRALHDPLTGLPNRAHVLEHLERAIARAARHGRLVGMLYVDVDDFKDINDSLGHAVGDEVLVALARRVRGVLRDGDVAARLGGDELVVVCDDLLEPGMIEDLAARVVDAVAQPLQVGHHVLHLTASVGVSTGGMGSSAERMVRDADAAMYRAKRAGKGGFEVGDDSLAALAIRQLEIRDGLHRALEERQLRLVYQPIVSTEHDKVVAVEALLRWRHPDRGLLQPADFIDVAESNELIVPIGRWVLDEATRQAADWARRLGPQAPRMWVNVSDRQVGRHDLAGAVREALDTTGLDPALLGIELTERQVVRTGHSVRKDLAALTDLGVQLAIDDFGTGRTGIDYLRELPVSAIKIDKSFVSGIGVEQAASALTQSLITLGHGLGLAVTAEGVETPEQLGQLRRWGCDKVQGYLLGRPQDAVSVVAGFGAAWLLT
jgi:diguanylate cyclase (GGDEF)-like protein/PAS domain S-box-containing protein